MSKAEEYLEDIKNHIEAGYQAYEEEVKTMNHKTLEDVEGLIKDRIDELGNGQISLRELKTLKL